MKAMIYDVAATSALITGNKMHHHSTSGDQPRTALNGPDCLKTLKQHPAQVQEKCLPGLFHGAEHLPPIVHVQV